MKTPQPTIRDIDRKPWCPDAYATADGKALPLEALRPRSWTATAVAEVTNQLFMMQMGG